MFDTWALASYARRVAIAFVTVSWPLAAFALGAIGALQLPAAQRVWPRITPGRPLR